MLPFLLPAQQQIITATLTVTNTAGTANTNTITLNGVTRNFTNYVANYQTSILASNSIWAASSNIFIAYISYAQGSVVVSQPNTNQIGYMSYPNAGLTLSISPGWGIVSWYTNSITNSIVVRVPVSSVGIYDLTNIANGLRDYLASSAVTSAIPSTAPILANVATLTSIQAQGAANTNFTLLASNNLRAFTLTIGQNETNFAMVVSNFYYNLFNTYNIPSIIQGGPAFQLLSHFQSGSMVLSNLVADYPLGIPANLSYYWNVAEFGGYGNDIVLLQTNVNGGSHGGNNYDPFAGTGGDAITRLVAPYGQAFEAAYEDGYTFLEADTSHNTEVYDHAGTVRWQMYDSSQGAPQGGNVWAGSGNVPAMSESANGYFHTLYPITADTPQFPIVLAGTTTNYWGELTNGPSGTEVDNYTVPAYTMTNNGDCITRTIGVLFSSGTSLKQVDVYFDGYQIFTTSTLTTTSGGSLSIVCDVTRISSTVYAFNCHAVGSGIGTVTGFSSVNTHGATFTSDMSNCYINLTASSTGAAAGQITVISDNTMFKPSATWQGVQ